MERELVYNEDEAMLTQNRLKELESIKKEKDLAYKQSMPAAI
jgi:hypothetical protein